MATLKPVVVSWRLVGGQLTAPGRANWTPPLAPPTNPPPTQDPPWFYLDDPGSVLDGPRKLA